MFRVTLGNRTSLMNSISVVRELRDPSFSESLHLNVRSGRGYLATRSPGAVREGGSLADELRYGPLILLLPFSPLL